MKYVRQIGIILGITLAGEFLNKDPSITCSGRRVWSFSYAGSSYDWRGKAGKCRRNRQFPDGYHVYDVCTGNSRDPGVCRRAESSSYPVFDHYRSFHSGSNDRYRKSSTVYDGISREEKGEMIK